LWFTLAYPIHWRYEHNGKILEEYQELVRNSFGGEFNQIRFVAEPEGAILSLQKHGLLTTGSRGGTSLVIDVGGSTTDIIAGEVDAKTSHLKFIGRYGEPFGGGLYDAELAKYISDELRIPASAIADDPSAMVSLRVAGQRLKESLSRQLSFSMKPNHPAQRTVTLVMQDGTVYRRTIHLEEALFGEITQHLDMAFVNLMENALRNIGLPPDDISQIILVGGGSQLFTIMNHLRERFGPDRILLADNPDEVVVGGIGLEYGASFEKREPTIIFPAQPQAEARLETPTPLPAGWSLLDEDGNRSDLGPGITRLGRGEANNIVIDDIKSSRFHAEISSIDGMLEIVDLGSTNGTFVNGQKLPAHDAQVLRVGDTISIGRIKFTVNQEAE
jgi:molecular chaperone DnaK (HSP70)